MIKDILYLASESQPRQRLLQEAGINFKTIKHNADECAVDLGKCFDSYVLDIAKEKMKHASLPEGQDGSVIFVLTSDTLVYTNDTGTILGKPKDIDDAKRMLRLFRKEKAKVVTGCCLYKKIYKNGKWQNEAENCWTTASIVEFVIEDKDFDLYFEKLPQFFKSASGGIIEGYGQRFCKSINGSYSNVIGLPLYELVQALELMGFNS